MNILLIEDHDKTQSWVKKGLEEAGFSVDTASDGRDGLYFALENDYQLVILDIMLPGMNGWDILKVLRTSKSVPVICLTARDAVDDRVKGLELGANDYLVKPFSFSELLARVKNQFKVNQPSTTCIEIADLKIDLTRHDVERGGKQIILTRQEYSLLLFFALHTDEILPRTLIASEVWGIDFESDTNIIDVAIRRLRKKIDVGYEDKLIETIRGMGYRFNRPNK
ncbi:MULTISPECIES: heavy metal response regulator transcription factor [Providencia]|uniref:Putative two-component system response regulator n=1 Tax=Providencia heimbachae ATCC 35613 TaxID=1354272 RepID=A0A1B7JW96_9GAMM|nr:heavy metal response regulator transcription factor [Providencia heimbachae]MBP6122047.1 heavy metal response regulator transcription factor [Providencia sp.]MDD9341273.1 heavy metal response regulator transcription factor [Providencia heimbachae]NIH24170.1 heavy metal response regulator transcription factor [Providencia heimbachae]OAT51964.1 putative two-component system response regulator [Providencia heimbachae ATCC 35613]QCJ71556.1 DNA-binding response regulator [Providencia heimbachae]